MFIIRFTVNQNLIRLDVAVSMIDPIPLKGMIEVAIW